MGGENHQNELLAQTRASTTTFLSSDFIYFFTEGPALDGVGGERNELLAQTLALPLHFCLMILFFFLT